MLGWVAAVSATESPSQLSPALIHSTWMRVSLGFCDRLSSAVGIVTAFREADGAAPRVRAWVTVGPACVDPALPVT